MNKGGKHSTSNFKPALSGKWDPLSTKTPRFTRAGHPNSSAVQVEVAGVVGRNTKPGKSSTTSFGRARYERQHGAGEKTND